MRTNKTLLLLTICLSLSGCIIVSGDGDWDDNDNRNSSWQTQQKQNRDNITKLTLGLTRTVVLARMGSPNFTEAFTGANGNPHQVLFYRTHREHGDGRTSKDETTALVFENDLLIGWGNDALQRIR